MVELANRSVNTREFPFSDVQNETHPAADILWQRKREGSLPGKRTDGRKVGAVVEGGAIRALASAAELVQVMHKSDLMNSFDAVYGESIGGPNAAWSLSGNLPEAIRVYYEDINCKEFVDFRRAFRKPIVDTYYLERVVMKKYPINYQAMLDTGISMGLIVACADQVKKGNPLYPLHLIQEYDSYEQFIEWCRGAIRIPVLEGPPVQVSNGIKAWDAGIVDKLPVQAAIEDGCTDIVVFSCVAQDYVPKQYPKLNRLLVNYFLNKHNPDLSKEYDTVKPRYAKTLDYLRMKNLIWDQEPNIVTIFLPAGYPKIDTFETNFDVLKNLESAAESAVHKVLYTKCE